MKTMLWMRVLLSVFSLTLLAASAPAQQSAMKIADGPFVPSFESLQQYHCPDWFRDAKFGIWSHWGPQAVPTMGDWYARRMYEQGGDAYEEHVKVYGHPSKSGYKDIIPLWKAENWNPEQLMELYVKAGAHYFVSMGVHHDNFDLWNSTYQPRWNAVVTGPKRDVLGDWQKAAKKHNLPFGVSEHLGASFTWFQGAHKSDKSGPMAGVPYDGADPQWADLYHPPTKPGDNGWLTTDAENHRHWFNRIKDVIDKYHPELLYSDSGFPFADDAGLPLVAHFYNANMKANGGQLTAVYNCKQASGGKWVQDLERGVMDKANPEPWQTDTSIGDWFYRRGDHYKSPETVIHMLCDIVSKNGNLLLNVVQRPDGSLEEEPMKILDELSKWMPINGEAIFGTRPWIVFGEGKPQIAGGMFNEGNLKYTADDVRFTTKGDTLYAIMLGWPEGGKATIKALAKNSPAVAAGPMDVSLLGYDGKLKWTRTNEGLEITLPEKAPSAHAVAFKISGLKTTSLDGIQMTNWLKILLPPPDKTIAPDKNGVLNLGADKAEMHGGQVKTEGNGNNLNIGFWDKSDDWVSWDKVKITQPGTYKVSAQIAAMGDNSGFSLEIGGQTLKATAPNTGDWTKYQTVELGQVEIKDAGTLAVNVRPDAATWKPINLRSIQLTLAK